MDYNFIQTIDIMRDRSRHWQAFGVFMVNDVDRSWLQSRISIKDSNLDRYKMAFDENWLLLVGNLGHESSTYSFPALDGILFQTRFDHIYLYLLMNNKIIVIK